MEPVKAMKRVCGCSTSALPKLGAVPEQRLTTPSGRPASSRSSTKRAAMVGASTRGLEDDGVAETMDAAVMPAMMAKGKFHGGMTAPTPSGM